MPKYALERILPSNLTREQIDGMVMANLNALETYIYRGTNEAHLDDHGIRWIRTYWEEGGNFGMCLYEAPNLRVLDDYQRLCGLPYIEAREVEEVPGSTESAGGEHLVAKFDLPAAAAPEDSIEALAGLAQGTPVIRAYWDRDRHRAVALFDSADPVGAARLAAAAATPPTRIIEVDPTEYA
jgi:hypothetical protein